MSKVRRGVHLDVLKDLDPQHPGSLLQSRAETDLWAEDPVRFDRQKKPTPISLEKADPAKCTCYHHLLKDPAWKGLAHPGLLMGKRDSNPLSWG